MLNSVSSPVTNAARQPSDDQSSVFSVPASITYETDAVIGTPRAPFIIDLDTATGIGEMANGQRSGDVYDLLGRKLNVGADSSFFTQKSPLRRGVYIVNGQKIVK